MTLFTVDFKREEHNMKQFLKILCVILVFVLFFLLITRLLEPKYMTDLVEGSMIAEYYQETGKHDVIFIGDCEVYANFSPMVLYQEEGITAYIRGTSQQLLWQSYGILKETLKQEKPKVVVFNVNALRYGEPVSEAYNRLTLDKMKWSKEKVEMIQASMTEEENFVSYVFPILRYHARFSQLTSEDFTYFAKEKKNTHNGFLINQHVKPAGSLPTKKRLPSYDFPENTMAYLEKMANLCKENGIEFVLIKAPSLYPYWYEEYNEQIVSFAQKHDLDYYNLKEVAEEIGIDYTTDTYDGGLHMNLKGATKLSKYFAKVLKEEYGLEDYRENPEIRNAYKEKLKQYEQAIEETKI